METTERSFTGHFEILASISEFVAESVNSLGLSEREVYALQLAVDEAATNILEYAYRDHKAGTIDLSLDISPHQRVVITLHDQGQPFDPNLVQPYSSDVPLNEMSERGAGLHLIHAIMDQVDFKFDKRKGNTLQMVKFIE